MCRRRRSDAASRQRDASGAGVPPGGGERHDGACRTSRRAPARRRWQRRFQDRPGSESLRDPPRVDGRPVATIRRGSTANPRVPRCSAMVSPEQRRRPPARRKLGQLQTPQALDAAPALAPAEVPSAAWPSRRRRTPRPPGGPSSSLLEHLGQSPLAGHDDRQAVQSRRWRATRIASSGVASPSATRDSSGRIRCSSCSSSALRFQDVAQVVAEHLPGAEDPVLDRADRQAGDPGDLVVAAVLAVAQQDQLPVVRRQIGRPRSRGGPAARAGAACRAGWARSRRGSRQGPRPRSSGGVRVERAGLAAASCAGGRWRSSRRSGRARS